MYKVANNKQILTYHAQYYIAFIRKLVLHSVQSWHNNHITKPFMKSVLQQLYLFVFLLVEQHLASHIFTAHIFH